MPIEFDSSKFPHREVIYRDIDFPEAVTRKKSRDADRRAVETFGIPGILLTENAAVAFLHMRCLLLSAELEITAEMV